MQIMPNGSKYWRLKYRYLKKEKHLALGVYPAISLAKARKKRDEARVLLAEGIDPSEHKKKKQAEKLASAENTFRIVAHEFIEKSRNTLTDKTVDRNLSILEKNVFADLGDRPIKEIEPPDILACLRKIEARGAHYLAGRAKQLCGQVFRYGVATGRNPRDPTRDLDGALTPHKTKHFASIDLKELPEFLKTLENNDARLFPATKRAIKLLMLTFVRTSELIEATWDEIDLDNAVWEIPAERMKMDAPHIVPLSAQALEIFTKQKQDTEHLNTPYVFPNQVRPQKHMSNNTILRGLEQLGYKKKMTGHGFRSLAMTALLEKLDYSFDIADAQLAHAKGDSVRRAYDRAKYLPQRTKMMQDYAFWLDNIAAGGQVIKGRFECK